MKKIIELDNLTKSFDGQVILKGIHLDIYENEFVTLLGPSGCGKTTTLRIMAGFEEPESGTVLFDGMNMEGVPPYKRELNTVFQKYALFPHMDVYDNVAFGLHIKKMPDEIIDHKVLLLDEPLGALDLKLRKTMQIELKKIQQQVGITFVYVTHDQEEALTMSDKIVVMNEGLIQQIGSPIDIYNEPENRFVANFIGESNIVEGHFIKDYLVEWHGQQFECVDKGFEEGQEVDIVLRPEDLDIVEPGRGKIAGEVVSVIFKGVQYEIMVRTENQDYKIHTTDLTEVGKKVDLDFWPEDIHVMEPMGTY